MKPKAEHEPRDEEDDDSQPNKGHPLHIIKQSQSSTAVNRNTTSSDDPQSKWKKTKAAIYMSMSNLRPVSATNNEPRSVLRKKKRDANKSYTSEVSRAASDVRKSR